MVVIQNKNTTQYGDPNQILYLCFIFPCNKLGVEQFFSF